jgi:hypothetical protein
MELEKILEKNKKLHIQIRAITLKMTSCRTTSKIENLKKKSENPRFYNKTCFILSTLAFNPWDGCIWEFSKEK